MNVATATYPNAGAPVDVAGLSKSGAAPGPVLFAVDALVVAPPGGEPLFPPVSFSLHAGEIIGLLGPNGSGKSTLLRLLGGSQSLVGGRVTPGPLGSAPIRPHQDWRWRSSLGIIYQQPSLDPKLTVGENLNLAASLQGLAGAHRRSVVSDCIAEFELEPLALRLAGTLSGGELRRADLARALIHAPSILLLDEPTQGLDEPTFRQFWMSIQRVAALRSVGVLLATHRAEEAEQSHRLLLLRRGLAASSHTPQTLRALAGSLWLEVMGVSAPQLEAALSALGIAGTIQALDSRRGVFSVQVDDAPTRVPALAHHLLPYGLSSLAVRQPSLADAFALAMGAPLTVEASD